MGSTSSSNRRRTRRRRTTGSARPSCKSSSPGSRPTTQGVGHWWFDAALGHKFLRNWAQAYRLGVHAATQATQDPAFCNLGIAATIQRDWATGRGARAPFGVPMPAGEGPTMGNFGQACVPLTGEDGSEVVWIPRVRPTRGRASRRP
jgi:hypothetical protein